MSESPILSFFLALICVGVFIPVMSLLQKLRPSIAKSNERLASERLANAQRNLRDAASKLEGKNVNPQAALAEAYAMVKQHQSN